MEVFGAADLMSTEDWDWGTRRIETVQNKSQTFQKLFQQLHLVDHQYFLIATAPFGRVDTTKMVNWDWETQEHINQRKLGPICFNAQDYKEELAVGVKEAIGMVRKLRCINDSMKRV